MAGQINQPVGEGISPLNQIFYFLAEHKTVQACDVKIEFGLYCFTTGKLEKSVEIKVLIVPANDANDTISQFLKYSENEVSVGMGENLLANLMYGYPCNLANLKYGYPCANLKYGYPNCDIPTLKYGYPDCE